MKDDKTFRMSQGITTFGVGSIIGIGDESFVNTGVTNDHLQYQINFPRLENRLRVNSLRYPKEKSKFGSEPNKFDFMRFPGWMFCKSCRMMTRLTYQMSKDLNGKAPICDNMLFWGMPPKAFRTGTPLPGWCRCVNVFPTFATRTRVSRVEGRPSPQSMSGI